MNDNSLTNEEVRNALYPWRLMKYDISFNTTTNDFMVEPLRYVLSISLALEIFPAEMENAQITPIYKGGDKESVINYRPIFVLLCFSKTLERIMYDRLHLYLTENNLLYNKEFGFQKDWSCYCSTWKSNTWNV